MREFSWTAMAMAKPTSRHESWPLECSEGQGIAEDGHLFGQGGLHHTGRLQRVPIAYMATRSRARDGVIRPSDILLELKWLLVLGLCKFHGAWST